MPKLEIENLSRRFGTTTALDGVSLTVEEGAVTCLLGASGCGKSTTLRIVAGIETADDGDVRLDGSSILAASPEARGIGLMFQDFALFPHLRVGENVAYGLRDKHTAKARVASLLKRVGLSTHIDKYPHELSGGEQQRVALARAIAPKPGVMLMDEPFSGLDERLRDTVRDDTLAVLREEGTAIILVTHDPMEAMRMADEIALMRAGRIIQRGAPITMFNAPVDLEAARFFSDVNVLPGRVKGGVVETVFGPFVAQGHDEGSAVDIAIRPQNVGIDFYRARGAPRASGEEGSVAEGRVLRARFLGQISEVDFDVDGLLIRTTLPGVFLPPVGRSFNLRIPRRHCHLFSRSGP
ncbi:MAG: ABC transporter ATP-binding protein [Pseudomonadota bacterium]